MSQGDGDGDIFEAMRRASKQANSTTQIDTSKENILEDAKRNLYRDKDR